MKSTTYLEYNIIIIVTQLLQIVTQFTIRVAIFVHKLLLNSTKLFQTLIYIRHMLYKFIYEHTPYAIIYVYMYIYVCVYVCVYKYMSVGVKTQILIFTHYTVCIYIHYLCMHTHIHVYYTNIILLIILQVPGGYNNQEPTTASQGPPNSQLNQQEQEKVYESETITLLIRLFSLIKLNSSMKTLLTYFIPFYA